MPPARAEVFTRETKRALAEGTPVLLLLRGDFGASERALAALQKEGRFVAVSLKETGLHQIADQLRDPARLARLLRIVNQADACLAPTPEAADFYRAIRSNPDRVAFIPTPYPIDDRRWDFSRSIGERSGIFIGTREWKVLSRNHLGALLVARQLSEQTGERVTVFNFDGRKGARLIAGIGFASGKLRVLDRRASYPELPSRNRPAQNRASARYQFRSGSGRRRRFSLSRSLRRRKRRDRSARFSGKLRLRPLHRRHRKDRALRLLTDRADYERERRQHGDRRFPASLFQSRRRRAGEFFRRLNAVAAPCCRQEGGCSSARIRGSSTPRLLRQAASAIAWDSSHPLRSGYSRPCSSSLRPR